MDQHFSWYLFFPFYSKINNYLVNNFSFTVIFNNGFFPKNPTIDTIHHIFTAIFVFIIIICIFLSLKNKINDNFLLIPRSDICIINILEFYLKIISGLMKDIIGNDYTKHICLIFTLSSFILISNLIGLIPGFLSASDNLNTTLACGLFVFIYFNFYGLKINGISHITHLANPIGYTWGWFLSPLMFPVELVGLCIRPFSLAVRLACNMMADHKVLFTFTSICSLIVPLPFLFLGLMVSIVQTTVFCLLTCVYISLHAKSANH